MTIIVTGSIAIDQLSTFPGRFVEQLVPGALDHLSLSFLVDSLQVRRGGVAANIALGLARLGLRPAVVAAAGQDFAGYRSLLELGGVDVASIRQSEELHTARFQCITDHDGNQLASFYAGAMSLARGLDLRDTVDRLAGVDQIVIGPNDPEAMLRHTDECRARDYPFTADPSQQLAVMEPKDIRRLIEGAQFLFTNAYEHALVLQKTEWTEREVLARVATWVTTLGPGGARIDRAGRPAVQVPAVPVPEPVDPTGVGDAFRAGFLAAAHAGADYELAARLGCTLAALVLRTVGPQEYEVDRGRFLEELTAAYGRAAASRTAAVLGW
ncbi:carbohydrate kinase family protein [Amorphoplanes digitatis]|uniref:Adenosine kinase n=1 Tax=Actinoplanes digitatis TaxID=1868 RepID=A0A7W7MQD0_9ACTN|nr:carbohydrate kinase family protein [Actinoplanes digitatis]MBB4763058.1 adenosine kinase [Actinoplanes digitatis]GID95741.1 kinase [Actinoplanes digitatis]